MKIFTNKNLIQKLIIAIVCITLLNFCMAPKVQADFGGKMMSYIRDFATALGDVAISLVQLGITGKWTYAVDDKGTGQVQNVSNEKSDYWIKDSKFQYPVIQISPELIFGDKVELLGIDFIGGDNGAEGDDKYILKTDGNAIEKLRVIIASWYVTLRTIAIVGLLSVLIYIGIRIIISSTSQDRAKYKQRLVDWIIAFCLLFFMHYIMAAAVNVIGQVNDILAKNIVSGIKLSPEFGNVKYDSTGGVTPDSNGNANSTDGTYTFRKSDAINQIENLVTVNSDQDGSNRLSWFMTGADDVHTDIRREVKEDTATTYTIEYRYVNRGVGKPNVTMIVTMNLVKENDVKYISGGTVTTSDSSIFKTETLQSKLNVSQVVGQDTRTTPTTNTESSDYDTNTGTVRTSPKSADGKEGHEVMVSDTAINGDGSEILYYINYARLYLNVSTKDKYIAISIGYLILYLVLVVFTIMFAVRYMKRVIYVAFLTLIAPMVAMTYPLDKIKDRKSTSL